VKLKEGLKKVQREAQVLGAGEGDVGSNLGRELAGGMVFFEGS